MSNEKQDSPAFIVTKYKWDAQVPQHHLYSDSYIEHYGTPTSGDRDVDRNLAYNFSPVRMSIYVMASILQRGGKVKITYPEETPEMYKAVDQLLREWDEILSNPLKTKTPDMEELKMLNLFKTEVFKIAQGFMDEMPMPQGLLSQVQIMERGLTTRFEAKKNSAPRVLREDDDSVIKSIEKSFFEASKNARLSQY